MSEYVDVEFLITQFLAFIPLLISAILVLLVFYIIKRVTSTALRNTLIRAGMDRPLVELLVDQFYATTVLIIGVAMAASQLGIDIGAALAGIGVAGIAIGFAAQDTLSNVISGIMIFWDKPFSVGDYITVSDQYGRVTEITLRSTRIRTNQNTFVVIPNKVIVDQVLVNSSKRGNMRVEVPVGIAYGESISEARTVLLEAVSTLRVIMTDPVPDVVVEALADSSVNLLVRVWISEASREKPVYFRVIEVCKDALDQAGIEIPFPHRQLIADWEKVSNISLDTTV